MSTHDTPSYFALFDVNSPPLEWTKARFIDALHVLSRFNRDELQSIVEEMYPDEIPFTFPLSTKTLLVQIFAYFSPDSFQQSIYSPDGILGKRLSTYIK